MTESIDNIRFLFGEDIEPYSIKYRVLDDEIIHRILRRYGKDGFRGIVNSGKGKSRTYRCRDDFGRFVEINTFQGNNAEYIVFPHIKKCSCRSIIRHSKEVKEPCYHIIAFIIDQVLGNTVSIEYPFNDFTILSRDFTQELIDLRRRK